MAPNDAEMAARQSLNEDIDQLRQVLAALREDLKWLADDVKRLGAHQLQGMQEVKREIGFGDLMPVKSRR